MPPSSSPVLTNLISAERVCNRRIRLIKQDYHKLFDSHPSYSISLEPNPRASSVAFCCASFLSREISRSRLSSTSIINRYSCLFFSHCSSFAVLEADRRSLALPDFLTFLYKLSFVNLLLSAPDLTESPTSSDSLHNSQPWQQTVTLITRALPTSTQPLLHQRRPLAARTLTATCPRMRLGGTLLSNTILP